MLDRIAPYLGIVAALAVGVLAVVVSQGVTYERPVAPATSSTTLAVVSPITWPKITIPPLVPAEATSSLPAKTSPTPAPALPPAPAVPPQKETAPLPTQATSSQPTTSAPVSSGNPSFDQVAAALRGALVNILCYAPAGSPIHSISGSGVIVTADGLVLTNAHVAQYFLLADQGVSCTLRTGSPARNAYTAKLAFISPTWVHNNASLIVSPAPQGQGDYDYAFLAISGTTPGAASPARPPFPYLPPAAYPPAIGTPVIIGSYGAQFLETSEIQDSLFPTIVYGLVQNVYRLGDNNTADVLDLGGSAAAQEGSSGGGAVNAVGALVGTITTSTVTGSTDSRELDAITSSYVRATYATETGSPIEFLLEEATSTAVAHFADEASSLESVLLAAING